LCFLGSRQASTLNFNARHPRWHTDYETVAKKTHFQNLLFDLTVKLVRINIPLSSTLKRETVKLKRISYEPKKMVS
jgi:hypothetical protein